MTDLDKLRKGEKELVKSIYDYCYPTISDWIRRNSGSELDSEDVFQEALVATFIKAKDPNFKLSCKVSTFVFSVAKNIWLNRLRTKNRFVSTGTEEMDQMEGSSPELVEEIVLQIDRQEVYTLHFNKLSTICKEILTQFFNGVSMTEIAKYHGFDHDSIARKRKFRCKQELISLVEKDPKFQLLKSSN
ncbi:MAG: RNA polymerase sigma factor (sigma-70 family) [Psychroserpens sp.]